MARAGRSLIVAAVLAALVPAWGETAPGGSDAVPHPQKRSGRGGKMSPEFENVRKAIEALTPEQRKRFQDNFRRWANLSPEQKKALRDRDESRRKRMAEEIEVAIKESGLELDKERRDLFARRYSEERRKIEEQLRREMEEKRKPLVQDLIARLKSEFTAAPVQP